MKTAALVLSVVSSLLFTCAGCGTGTVNTNCSATGITVSPATGTADHAASAPANSFQFAANNVLPSGCAQAAVIVPGGNAGATWTVSDTVHATISNAKDSTNGTATCIAADSVPITVTATATSSAGQTFTATATLTCK